MWNLFFSCISCQKNLAAQTLGQTPGIPQGSSGFPLCPDCAGRLVECPPRCPRCASPLCPHQSACMRPWIIRKTIHSYSARYLLTESCYQVLKKWKIHGGTLFHQKILRSTPALLKTWQDVHPQAVIPVPQRFARAWSMRGSRADRIARWIGVELGLPVLEALRWEALKWEALPGMASHRQRQAERKASERFQARLNFGVNDWAFAARKQDPLNPANLPVILSVILVDDFMTTGRTLEKAALALQRAGIRHVHAFCLGVRIPGLDQGGGRTESIG